MIKVAGVLVVAAWLAMMGVMAYKNAPPEAPAPSLAGIDSGEDWMGIYLNGGKIGYAVDRVNKTPDGYAISEEVVTELTVQGSRQEIRTTTDSRLDASLVLRDFTFSLKSGIANMTMKGVVEGSVLKLDIDTAGRVVKQEIPLIEPPHLSTDLELYLKREGISVGKKYRLPFFDPSSMSKQYVDIDVEAREDIKIGDALEPVYRVKERYEGITVTAWINPGHGVVKGEGPMGFTFLRETKEQALSKPKGGYQPPDVIALAAIEVVGDLPEPRKAAYMKARLTRAELDGLTIDGGRQVFKDGIVEVTREDADALPHVKLPVTGAEFARYLKPEALVQSDDPQIHKKAVEILAGETDALAAARKLSGWVNKSVKKVPSAGIPSAVEILGSMSGDCNEHTTLFAALARSVGLPTKTDAGIVMLDGRFYYHAWPEVYVGGWVAIDPTFGQFPADATHIRLAEGGPEQQVAMLKLVGKLKVEIMEYR